MHLFYLVKSHSVEISNYMQPRPIASRTMAHPFHLHYHQPPLQEVLGHGHPHHLLNRALSTCTACIKPPSHDCGMSTTITITKSMSCLLLMFLSITISMALYMISQLYHVGNVIVINTLFICNCTTVDNSSHTKHHCELDGGLGGGVWHFFDRGLLESKKPSYMIILVMYKKYHRVNKNVQAYRSQEHPLGFCSTCLIHS